MSALYVDPERGPYLRLLGAERVWGVGRDARRFRGPGPVVAHPPCGPWGRLRNFCTRQDPGAALVALRQVRRFGGVLEHPTGSVLWRAAGLPLPMRGEGELPLLVGREWTLQVNQVRWGHPAIKSTWLLFVGVPPASLPAIPSLREPTHRVGAWRRTADQLPCLWSTETHITPPSFAAWLVTAAALANV